MAHTCRIHQTSDFQYKQRYIPTFVHEPIFFEQSIKYSQSRFNPTFYSTALDTSGYNVKTVHSKRGKPETKQNSAEEKVIYTNYSHQRRIQDLNPRSRVFYSTKDKWYDHTKQQLLETMKNCRHQGYSKERKFLDLTSDPVFTDFNYKSNAKNYPNLPYLCQCCQNVAKNKLDQASQTQNNIVNVKQTTNPQINTNSVQENQNKEIQIQNEQKQVNRNNKIQQNSSKKDFHKDCIPQISRQGILRTTKAVRPQSLNKKKIVSSKPTFSLVRGNKIQNRL